MILPGPWLVVRTRAWTRDLPLSSLGLFQLSQPDGGIARISCGKCVGPFHSSILSSSFRNHDPTVFQVPLPLSTMLVVSQVLTFSVSPCCQKQPLNLIEDRWQKTKISLNIFLNSDAKCKRQQKINRFTKQEDFQVIFPSWTIPETPEE